MEGNLDAAGSLKSIGKQRGAGETIASTDAGTSNQQGIFVATGAVLYKGTVFLHLFRGWEWGGWRAVQDLTFLHCSNYLFCRVLYLGADQQQYFCNYMLLYNITEYEKY
jgi:hypothetical protein